MGRGRLIRVNKATPREGAGGGGGGGSPRPRNNGRGGGYGERSARVGGAAY
ncbi:MAG: hypothetical protein ACKOOH_01435 [Cyanobium sp.]